MTNAQISIERKLSTGRVEDNFRSSASAGRIAPAKDSDPEPPTAPTVGMWSGVQPTTLKRKKGRLMPSVERTPEAPPPPTCPTCGTAADRTSVRRESGTLVGDYACPCGHIWTTRWMEVV